MLYGLRMKKSWLLLLGLLVAGCNLYFGGGGDDQPCPDYAKDIATSYRDPQTGECTVNGGGGGGGCYGADTGAAPNLPLCYGMCDALDEASCIKTPGCHAQYTGTTCPPGADCPDLVGPQFWTCAQTAPYASNSGSCWGLDAQLCSERDDCGSAYNIPIDPPAHHAFTECFPEPGTVDVCGAVDCAPGSHCEPQCTPCDLKNPNDICVQSCKPACVPDTSTCAVIFCGPDSHCEQTCQPDTACDAASGPGGGVCAPICTATCVPNAGDPGSCKGDVVCKSIPPACPPSTVPGIKDGCWTGYCIPTDLCDYDAGSCSGPVSCGKAPPPCPSNSKPGIKNGCWTGFCIPETACYPMQQACAALVDEKSCLARPDCMPVYDGKNCTCDAKGVCTCTDKAFARCS